MMLENIEQSKIGGPSEEIFEQAEGLFQEYRKND
jgi:hypothetical protein